MDKDLCKKIVKRMIIKLIKMEKDYPNDSDLGRHIRTYINKLWRR